VRKLLSYLSFAMVLMVPLAVRAQTSNGALKVTSFPVGASVSVDGVDTGKVTPMTISVAVGTHRVVVSIPNSGWNPDTRTVEVVSGNNDLSVTLLPTLTAGPMGPPGPLGALGPAGPTGSQGPQGPAGSQGPIGLTGATGAAGAPGTPGVAGPAGPAGATGPTGPAGPQGPAGASGLNGMAEFAQPGSFTFIVPPGVTHLSVDLYGAGGGSTLDTLDLGTGGGGAYSATILTVNPNDALTVVVGSGGAAQQACDSGVNGGDTQILGASQAVLAVAHGGTAGLASSGSCGPGAGGAGGTADPAALISHAGAPGAKGLLVFSPYGGAGYLVPGFPFQSNVNVIGAVVIQVNGQFGAGGSVNPGQGGYALLRW
jgi:hypothetical protein